MLKKLYGEDVKPKQADEATLLDNDSFPENDTTSIVKEKMKKRAEFSVKYGSYICVSFIQVFCCCFTRCCKQGSWCRR